MMKIAFLALCLLLSVGSQAQTVIETPTQTQPTAFAIVIDNATYRATRNAVMQYRDAVQQDGLAAYIVRGDWKNPDEVKTDIAKVYRQAPALEGIVLVGDPDQLPSVGAGQVFASLIKSGKIPVTVLDRIFRQSKDGLIAYNAKFINEGSTRLYYGSDFEFVESGNQQDTAAIIMKLYTDEIEASGIENVQILSPFRSRGEVSADLLNLAIREQVNPFRTEEEDVHLGIKVFRVGDRVMQTKNTEKVSNGDLGFVRSIETRSDGKRVLLDFGTERLLTYSMEELANLDLAYATTIHKAMGSEFETVIVPVIKPHAIMLYRNLLYTAITRARKKVILVGQKSTLFLAIHKSDISKRNTKLADRIQMYSQVLAADHTTRLPEAV